MRILRDEIPDFAEALSAERRRAVIGSKATFDVNKCGARPVADKQEAAGAGAMKRAGFYVEVK